MHYGHFSSITQLHHTDLEKVFSGRLFKRVIKTKGNCTAGTQDEKLRINYKKIGKELMNSENIEGG